MSLSLNFPEDNDNTPVQLPSRRARRAAEQAQHNNTPVRQNGIPRQSPNESRALPSVPEDRPGSGLSILGNNDEISKMFDDDEETLAINAARSSGVLDDLDQTDPESAEHALKVLTADLEEHRKLHSANRVKAARFISGQRMLELPQGFFNNYMTDVDKASRWIREEVAERQQSHTIAEAQRAPLDEALQEEAFNVVNSITLEYLSTRLPHYRGIEKELVKSLIFNEIIGFGPIDPLWRDRKIDEIAINGPYDIQVQIDGHRHYVPSCVFRDEQHLMDLLERIFGAISKQLSRTNPLVKGRLHDNSRIFATHTVVSPSGPNVLIRRHPERYWTPQDLIDRDSASEELLTYLGNLIYKGCSIAVIGGTGTGKTTFLNALTGFYRNTARIFTLEDNIEMLPNPTKMLAAAMECRPPNSSTGEGAVTMRDLLRGTLQLSPDVIIIGEVTDGAAMDLVQALNTGHYGASTVHANTPESGIHRIASLVAQSGEATLQTSLPLIATAFDVVVHLERFPSDGTRKITSISEVALTPEVHPTSGEQYLPVKTLWKFMNEGIDRNGKVHGTWQQVGEISRERAAAKSLGLERDLTWEELSTLSHIPEHLRTVGKTWGS